MNSKKIKKIKKQIQDAIPPGTKKRQAIADKAIRDIKALEKRKRILIHLPKYNSILSEKMHKKESLNNFRKRRKACNKRRRIRERQAKWIRSPEQHKLLLEMRGKQA